MVQSKNLISRTNFAHACSGAMGSMIGMTVFYPLDTVRCRLQLEENRQAKNTFSVIADLVREEGVLTLYRGIVPVLQSVCVSNFVYFYTYQGLKGVFWRESSARDLAVATIAGVVNTLLTSPLWTVNTRLKMSGIDGEGKYSSSLSEGMAKMCREEGMASLWRGTMASLVLVSNPTLHMVAYEALKRRLPRAKSPVHHFLMGAAAKTVATILTYPIQLVQTILRHGRPMPNMPPTPSILALLIHILRKQGVMGLYRGLEAKLLQTVLTAALMFSVYERLARTLVRLLASR